MLLFHVIYVFVRRVFTPLNLLPTWVFVVFGISRSALGKSGKWHIIRIEKSFANFFYACPGTSGIMGIISSPATGGNFSDLSRVFRNFVP
jgi:hypothetical protein